MVLGKSTANPPPRNSWIFLDLHKGRDPPLEHFWIYMRNRTPLLKDWHSSFQPCTYRATSLIRNSVPPGPYSRDMSQALWRP